MWLRFVRQDMQTLVTVDNKLVIWVNIFITVQNKGAQDMEEIFL